MLIDKINNAAVLDNPIQDIINARVFMSPMAGVTDLPFRLILQKFGCRFAFTEMIDANGLYYNNKKTFKMLTRTTDAITIGAQIAGADEERIIKAARICEDMGFGILELNAGCPAKKVIKDGKGAALLKDPKKLGILVYKLTSCLKIPVTVKIRSGWSEREINYLETAKIIAGSGASAICIHPRTKTQMYAGVPNHEFTRDLKQSVGIPVFASGNILNCSDVKKVFSETGCDAVAVARGCLGRPWIFKEIYEDLNNAEKGLAPSFPELKKIILEHALYCLEFFGEEKTFLVMYKHMQWYLKYFKNRLAVMKKYSDVKTFSGFQSLMEQINLDCENKLCLD